MKNIFFSLITLFTSLNSQAQSPIRLPRLNVNPSEITVSGVSAGAFMAIQLQVSLSKIFSGAAAVAGGIYWCSQGSASNAQTICMKMPEQINTKAYVQHALSEAQAGKIDDLQNLSRSRFYIFGSSKDYVVNFKSGEKLAEFLSAFVPPKNIYIRSNIPAGHGWVTKDFGSSCTAFGVPWILNCNFDMAGELLNQLYPELQPPSRIFRSNEPFVFDQKEFSNGSDSLFSFGYIYIPQVCQSSRVPCRLHVALHGCQMSPDYIENNFAHHSGLNSWAEANRIIVLYPQNAKNNSGNSNACWDWYGYTGPNFANRNGVQIQAIQKMLERILGTKL